MCIRDSPPGGHGAEGDDLGHVVGAVLVLDVLNDLLPPADAEVDVDVRHGDPLRVQKPLEVEGISVSYTHLDVYKRQELIRPAFLLSGGRSGA